MNDEELQIQWFHTGTLASGRYNIPATRLTFFRNVAVFGILLIVALMVIKRGKR